MKKFCNSILEINDLINCAQEILKKSKNKINKKYLLKMFFTKPNKINILRFLDN